MTERYSVRYLAQIYEQRPEKRWFYRRVLKRNWQRHILLIGSVDSFTIEKTQGGLTTAAFVIRDPMESLARTESVPNVGS